ncbi:FAD-dependent oxidoreductase [Niallia sp. Krafla_26]|uniref:oxidoreductase n=1 Tax=Niallia sp. Krafla_26 TaxID=3064703 RepID=UPI003D1636E0
MNPFLKEKTTFSHLFKPGKIGNVEIKNRIVKAPQHTGLANQDGTVSERLIRHYKELARGGTGLIIVEYTYVDNDASKSAFCQLGISKTEHISGLSYLASTIKEEGAKAGIQLEHCGRQKFLGTPPMKAPSRIPWPMIYEQTGMIPEELTITEIKQIIENFGDAAKRAEIAGFDLVEIHAAHGYLITNFLSPHTNKRNDLYGGSLENRMRFLIEVIENVKSKVSEDFTITMRINGTDYQPDGIKIEETIEVCIKAEELGVQAFHVSGGDHHQMIYQVSPMPVKRGPNIWAADAIRQNVSIPIIASGSITSPDLAQTILEEGKADFVSFGRPLFADPYFPQKAKEGRVEDITPCIRCNDGCMERTHWKYRSIRCTVNPNTGREGELTLTPATKQKKIAVVGGGPAGLEVARVSALRGHEVTLFEKEELGGSLVPGSVLSFKEDLIRLQNYYKAQIEKLNIEVIRQEATVDNLQNQEFDEVILAIGGVPKPLKIDGLKESKVLQAKDVLKSKVISGQSVVVIGGSLVGIEAALFLADKGCDVTILEEKKATMQGDLATFTTSYMQKLTEKKVNVHLSTSIEEVVDDIMITVNKNGMKKEFTVDTIINATGYVSNDRLIGELKEQTLLEVHEIGDGKQPGKIFDAIHAGYLLGRQI